MRVRPIIGACPAVGAVALAFPTRALTEDPKGFIEQQHHRLEELLRAPSSATRDTQLHQALAAFVDYDELTHRAFGEPCPASVPSCDDLWSTHNDVQKAEVRG